ncbi:PAS domain S-box protein [Mucilaginibacter robiniae]|uniref:histidine kinase n=1 Tax=Mucilaginibacter robiniae TaxID=2728022 RepID=A0A7L5E1D9_9SPHI|nr:ATP-binding protein [Mucilaginibacter robiniae]QJD97200.1 PAS domain S-box protein [Mucilaginibacter robiniae]
MSTGETRSNEHEEIIISLKSEIERLKKEVDHLRSACSAEGKKEFDNSQTRFSTIFEYSKLGNKVIAADLKILQVNSAMVNLLGYAKKEEIIGTRILDYSPKENHKHWRMLQERLWKKSTPSFSLETVLIKKDGSLIWCRVTSILFPDQGQQMGYTIIEDITENHELQLQKDEFIGIATHELKTPITSLKAALQLMNRMIKNEAAIPEKIAKLAFESQLYTSKLTHLVEDFLNTSKLEQGKLSINKRWFPLSDVIEGCCNHVQLDRRHFVTHSGDLSTVVYADRHKIDQIIVNFVNNALKYAPQSEEISIKVEQLENCTKISVTDKGEGIPAKDLPHLFDRYYQVRKGNSQSRGLGLGLYISAQIIKGHGGDIGVDSKVGEGSAFWFTLPHVQRDSEVG